MNRLAGWMVCGLLAAGIGPLQATVVVYNSQSAWLAAVTGVQTVTFDGMGQTYAGLLSLGNAPSQINVTVDGDVVGLVNSGAGNILGNDFSNVIMSNAGFGAMHFTADSRNTSTISALAANLFTSSLMSGLPVTVNVYLVGAPSTIAFTTTITTYNHSGQTPAFFGITSDQAIDHIDFVTASGDGPVVVDNLQWGQLDVVAAPTPEIPTYAYIGVGLAALFFGLHKRHSLA